MIEVTPGLFVGNQLDERHVRNKKPAWAVLHCAKDPYHREAVGYTGGAPKDHPEYLFAYRDEGMRLCLNMIDAPKPEFFADAMIVEGLKFIEAHLRAERSVLVHCNQGGSRGPSMALLYLRGRATPWRDMEFEDAEEAFGTIYLPYQPASGIREYVRSKW